MSYDRDDMTATMIFQREEIDRLTAELAEARGRAEYWKAEHLAGNAEIERLKSAIRWALGYDEGDPDFSDDFGKGAFAWRKELRRRAGLVESEVDHG